MRWVKIKSQCYVTFLYDHASIKILNIMYSCMLQISLLSSCVNTPLITWYIPCIKYWQGIQTLQITEHSYVSLFSLIQDFFIKCNFLVVVTNHCVCALFPLNSSVINSGCFLRRNSLYCNSYWIHFLQEA